METRAVVKWESIEVLRGVAALAVVLFHLTRRPEMLAGSWIRAMANYGYLGVDAFFVISGLVIPIALSSQDNRGGGAWLFLLKRWCRLYPPFFVSLILTLLLRWSVPALGLSHAPKLVEPLTALLANLGLACDFTGADWINPVYWTLSIEFQFYIFMAVGFAFWRQLNPPTQVGVLLALGGLALVSDEHGLIVRYLPFFCTGMASWLFLQRRLAIYRLILFVGVQAVLAYFSIDLAAALTLAASCGFCLVLLNYHFRSLLPLGSVSYSLYLLHVPIGSPIINGGLRMQVHEFSQEFLLLLAIAACLLAAGIFYFAVERPSLRLARSLSVKGARKPAPKPT